MTSKSKTVKTLAAKNAAKGTKPFPVKSVAQAKKIATTLKTVAKEQKALGNDVTSKIMEDTAKKAEKVVKKATKPAAKKPAKAATKAKPVTKPVTKVAKAAEPVKKFTTVSAPAPSTLKERSKLVVAGTVPVAKPKPISFASMTDAIQREVGTAVSTAPVPKAPPVVAKPAPVITGQGKGKISFHELFSKINKQ